MTNSHLWMCCSSSASSLCRRNSRQALRSLLNLRQMLFSVGFWTNLWRSLLCDTQPYVAGYRLVSETTSRKQDQKSERQWLCCRPQVPHQLGLAQKPRGQYFRCRVLNIHIFLNESPLAEGAWATHEGHEEVWRCSATDVTHMWWFLWWAPQNCGSPALRSSSTVRGLG